MVRVSAGISPFAAAEILSVFGMMKLPEAFFIWAIGIFKEKAYSDPTYPIAPGVWLIVPATPGLPLAAKPAGHFNDLPVPTFSFQSLLTFVK